MQSLLLLFFKICFLKFLYLIISELDEQFESLRKERELINNWKQEAERQLVETIGDGTVEIREDYNEDYERHWQEQHRESVRRHHQQLAKQRREAKQEKSQSVGDAELWVRLEELEIQEELQDYVERENISEEKSANISKTLTQATSHSNPRNAAVKDTEVSNSSAAAPVSENSASDNKTEVAPSAPAPKGKKVKFSADTIVHDISNDINYENQESYNQEKSTSSTVGFTDESTTQTYPCFDPIMIRFRHSSPADIGDDEDANASGTEEEDHTSQIVASPGEIVKVFGPTSISAISTKPLPKSILKPFAPPLTVAVTEPRSKKGKGKVSNKMKPVLSFADEDDSIDNGDDIDIDSICPVSKIVTERVPVFTALQLNDSSARQNSETDESNESKPVSLFKMRRQQQSVAMAATSPE